jgi:hypothetical protein
MHIRSILPVVIVLCALIAIAGCTGTQTPGTTPGQAAASSGTPAGTAGSTGPVSMVTQPTNAIPSYNAITVAVGEKDYLGSIPVIFQGGLGQIHVTKITATLYRADGQVITANIGNKKGDEADLQGTKQTDRVTVDVTMDNGETYRVADQLSEYRTRG